MAKRRKSRNYLNNRDLFDQMVLSKEQDKLTKDAEKMLILLAEKAINRMRYVSEDDRNDCLQFAILDLLKYWRNFNPKYPNAFAYFTEIAKRGYAKGWNKMSASQKCPFSTSKTLWAESAEEPGPKQTED